MKNLLINKNIKPILSKNTAILSGTEMIIPIEILSKISLENYDSTINYNELILNNFKFQEVVLLSFLLSFVTYKGDRLLDAEEYLISKKNNEIFEFNKKHIYYENLIENKRFVEFTLFISYVSILTLVLFERDFIYTLPLLISTFAYKYIKKCNILGFPVKPLYISVLWTYVSCILPILCISTFQIDIGIPTFLNIFATTNIADIKDYEEDLNNNICTLPTSFGKEESKYIIILCALLSNIYFVKQDNYILNLQNFFFIMSNIGSLFTLYKL